MPAESDINIFTAPLFPKKMKQGNMILPVKIRSGQEVA